MNRKHQQLNKPQQLGQGAVLPCSRVLAIQELQDLIRALLPFRDLKTCTLVCRYWNRLFEPYLWTRLDLHQLDRGKRTILRRHGTYIDALYFVHACKTNFKFIRTHCPSLTTLSLVFDSDSTWISYSYLEKFFKRMSQLTTLQILFDASTFSPGMFWSLSQLRNLKSLMMDVYYTKYESSKHYPPEAYLAILDCCTHVRELIAGGMFLEPTEVAGLYVKSSVMQRMSKVLRPLRENAPATALEAMAAVERSSSHERSRSTGSRLSILKRSSVRMATFHSKSHSDSMKAAAVSPVEVPSRSVTYQIRRLELKSSRMDIDVFCTLTSRCTLLEELVLDGLWIRITDDTWRTLAVKCPRLRTLKVCGSGDQYLPSTQTLITIFPRLETLSLMTIEFRTDPDLSNLGTTLQTIKQAQGDTHPLKSIHLSGSILKPLKVLLDIVTQSSTVESLSVGFTLTAMRDIAQEPGMPYELKKRWLCQESLMHLDLTSIAFQDKKIFSKVFGHIQRLPRLRSLRISVSHIREAWFFTTRSRSRGEPRNGRSSNREGASPLTYSISSSSTPDLRGLSSNGSRSRRTGFFCFSALEVLRIGVPYFVNNNSFETPIVFDEVVYMINASPRLKQVELKHLSESGMIKRLSGAYPRMEFS